MPCLPRASSTSRPIANFTNHCRASSSIRDHSAPAIELAILITLNIALQLILVHRAVRSCACTSNRIRRFGPVRMHMSHVAFTCQHAHGRQLQTHSLKVMIAERIFSKRSVPLPTRSLPCKRTPACRAVEHLSCKRSAEALINETPTKKAATGLYVAERSR